jgi:hypothetical protein
MKKHLKHLTNGVRTLRIGDSEAFILYFNMISPLKRFAVVIFVIVSCYGCSTESSSHELIKSSLAERNDAQTYKLNSITYIDTLSRQDFVIELNDEINMWKNRYDSIFQLQYLESISHFGADHVKHLHKERLTVESFLDSLDLVHAFLSSFISQDDFDELYLNECFQLQHTLDEVISTKSEVIWFGIEHSYMQNENPSSEYLLFFPEDSAFSPYDDSSSHIAIFNRHKFLINIQSE